MKNIKFVAAPVFPWTMFQNHYYIVAILPAEGIATIHVLASTLYSAMANVYETFPGAKVQSWTEGRQ